MKHNNDGKINSPGSEYFEDEEEDGGGGGGSRSQTENESEPEGFFGFFASPVSNEKNRTEDEDEQDERGVAIRSEERKRLVVENDTHPSSSVSSDKNRSATASIAFL